MPTLYANLIYNKITCQKTGNPYTIYDVPTRHREEVIEMLRDEYQVVIEEGK